MQLYLMQASSWTRRAVEHVLQYVGVPLHVHISNADPASASLASGRSPIRFQALRCRCIVLRARNPQSLPRPRISRDIEVLSKGRPFRLGLERSVTHLPRQAAICHLGSQEFARAAQIVRKGDADGREAGTWYVLFLVAVEQGIEDEGQSTLSDLSLATGPHATHSGSSGGADGRR
jgi:hypothetical protein